MGQRVTLGQQFGSLTVVELLPDHVEPGGHHRQRVRVLCTCGEKHDLNAYGLTRGTKCKTCSYAERKSIQIGQKFDQLTVEGFTSSPRSLAICRCDCGTLVTMRLDLLKKNSTNSCGCRPDGRWGGVGDLSRTFFYRIQRNAKVRNISFDITLQDMWDQWVTQKMECALTGIPLELRWNTIGTDTTASLDRIDSSKGYTTDNIQWVHKDINRMKMNLTEERFVELCRLVATRA